MSTNHIVRLEELFIDCLKKNLEGQKIHLGFDLWKSITHIPFLVATGHWIDDDWRLQRAGLLNFLSFFFFSELMILSRLVLITNGGTNW